MRAEPVVVIDEDRPQGEVLWACERARRFGVLVGQRYAYALSLCGALRARVVAHAQLAEALEELRGALHAVSPSVEPGEPGTFWLDGAGLGQVFPDAPGDPIGRAWGRAIAKTMTALGYRGAAVIGFARFATYAIARASKHIVVLASEDDERRRAHAVPLALLDVAPKLRDGLARLGVKRLGELVQLPEDGVRKRFGVEAHALYQRALGTRWDPVVAVAPPEAPDERVVLDDEEADLERLMFFVKPAMQRLLARLAARGRAVTALQVELTLKHGVGNVSLRLDVIKPSQPTLDERALLRLVHLRWSGQPLAAPANAMRVWADDTEATREQLALFAQRPRRDLRVANDAVARLRAELGDDAIVRAVMREGHLPEASFAWQRLAQVVPARPAKADDAPLPLIRRVFARPRPLPMQPRLGRDDGWLLSGLEQGPVARIYGPFVISGGWWAREQHRAYHYAVLQRGDCMWVYYDRRRRRWFWQGVVS